MEYVKEVWSNYDDVILEIMINEKIDLYEISLTLKRTLLDVQNRVLEKKLNNKYDILHLWTFKMPILYGKINVKRS